MAHRFAESYLNTRAKLADLLGQVHQLVDKSHTKVEGLLEMREALNDQLVLMACGDAGVGCADFLGTVLGVKVSNGLKSRKTSAVAFSKALDVSSFDIPVKKVDQPDLSQVLCVEGVPCDHLNQVEKELLEGWVGKADALFWVFSAENPWSSTTWGRIERLSEEEWDRSMVILAKTEGHGPDDIEVMIGHMRSLCEQRLGRQLPIQPVSSEKGKLFGYGEAWEHANQNMENGKKRRSYLVQVRDKLHRVLDLIEGVMDERALALEGDRGFLQSLESDIERQREREIQLYAGRGVNLATEFVAQIDPLLQRLHHKCGLLSSTIDLFGRGILARRVEKFFVNEVADAFVARSEADCKQILRDCREQWRKMQQHLDERLGGDAGGFQIEPFQKLLPDLMQRQEKAAKVAVFSMKLRTTMDYLLEPRRRLLKKLMFLSLSVVIVAGILGTLKVPPVELPALITLGVAGLSFLVYGVVVLASRQQAVSSMADRVVDLRADFTENVYEQYQDMIRELFTGYAPMFEHMRRQIAEAKMNLDPMQKEHHALFLQLKAIENQVSLG